MIRRASLCILFTLLGTHTVLGQTTRASEEPDASTAYKEAVALMRQAAQVQSRLEASHRRQVDDYNRRVDAQEQEQRRQYEDAQTRNQWVYMVGGVGIVLVIVWGALMTRKSHRKQDAAVAAIETSRLQNEQMIQALHTIAARLEEVKVLLGSSNRG